MSYVTALPAILQSAGGDLEATAIHELFVSTVEASTGSYAATEAAYAAAVH